MTAHGQVPPAALEEEVRDHFRGQAKVCDAMGSPFTAMLCRVLADRLDRSTATGRRVLDWPGRPVDDALSLRLCAGLHRLVLSRADPLLVSCYPPNEANPDRLAKALERTLVLSDDYLRAGLDSPPQTNEIARSAMLYPGFLTVARQFGMPLALHEIGSSAGLNLHFDRFHYRYGTAEAGDAASPVRLEAEVVGNPPPLHGEITIAARSGSDIAPVEIGDPTLRLRLRSFVWADQAARLARLDAAIGLALSRPVTLERTSAADFVAAALAARPRDAAFVLFHSIMWQYMTAAERRRVEALLAEAGGSAGSAPIAWLRMEPLEATDRHATLSLTTWPGGTTRHLARCDYHGRWIEWLE